jgi:hypothetical protein
MNKHECIERICRFPTIYKAEEVMTPLEIYLNSGYDEFYGDIQDAEIEAELKDSPNLVDEWIFFTEDKRWTPAWGICRDEDTYHVFHMQEGGLTDREEVFDSPFVACALMVRMEMETFRNRLDT